MARIAASEQAVKHPLYQEKATRGMAVTQLGRRPGVTKGAVGRALDLDNDIESFTLVAMVAALGCVWQVSLRRWDYTSDEDEQPLGS
jgi:hypothetical protein